MESKILPCRWPISFNKETKRGNRASRNTIGTMVFLSTATSMFRPRKTSLLLLLCTLSLLLDPVSAQVGTTICGCQPAVYEITLSFDVTCDDTDVSGPGINETACVISKETDEDVTDFRPVVVTDIQFLELNKDLATLQQEPRTGAFRDGDIVRYTSVLAVQDSFDELTLPRAFQMILRGFNAIDQPIQATWVITYDNDCGIFPILFEGQRIGWSVFTDLGNPPEFVCPLAGGLPSETPSMVPTLTPTSMPTAMPSRPAPANTAAPTVSPSFAPTGPPVEEPTTSAPTSGCPPIEPPYKGKGKGKGGKGKGGSSKSGKGKGKGGGKGMMMYMGMGGKMNMGGKMGGGKMYNGGGKMYNGGGKMYNDGYGGKDSSSNGKGGLEKKDHVGDWRDKGTRHRLLASFQEMLFGTSEQEDEWDEEEWDEEEWDEEEDEIAVYYPNRDLMTSHEYKNLGIDKFGGKMFGGKMYGGKMSSSGGKMYGGKMSSSGGKMSGGKMSGGKMSGGKMSGIDKYYKTPAPTDGCPQPPAPHKGKGKGKGDGGKMYGGKMSSSSGKMYGGKMSSSGGKMYGGKMSSSSGKMYGGKMSSSGGKMYGGKMSSSSGKMYGGKMYGGSSSSMSMGGKMRGGKGDTYPIMKMKHFNMMMYTYNGGKT